MLWELFSGAVEGNRNDGQTVDDGIEEVHTSTATIFCFFSPKPVDYKPCPLYCNRHLRVCQVFSVMDFEPFVTQDALTNRRFDHSEHRVANNGIYRPGSTSARKAIEEKK